MYETRFGLHRKPFQSVVHDSDFFRSEAFKEVAPLILHALKSDLGVAVLTGPTGCGKTASLDCIRRELSANAQTILLRGGNARNPTELLHSLYRLLLKSDPQSGGSVPDVVRRWDVLERLQRKTEFWGPLIILLDDAHLIQPESFAELRALLEEETNGQKLIRLLVSGPLALEEVLAQPAMCDFAQKIRSHVFLQPMRSVEAVEYLKHQIETSGGNASKVFDGGAIELIVTAADGNARCLNLLADESLMVCEETDSSPVTAREVNVALQRLQHLPVAWNAVPAADIGHDEYENETSDEPSSIRDSVIEIGGLSPESGVVEIGSPIERTIETVAVPQSVDEENTVEIGSESFAFETQDIAEPCQPDFVGCFETDADAPMEIETSAAPNQPCEIVESSHDSIITEEFHDTQLDAADCSAASPTAHDPSDSVTYWQQETETETTIETAFDDAIALIESTANDDTASDSDSSDLVHHLVLASSQENESATEDEDATETGELSSGSPPALFEDYTRWLPAGEWPAPAAISDTLTHSASVLDVEPALTGINRSPVFDRFTWQELGRSVGPDQRRQVVQNVTIEKLEWPPNVCGIAPFHAIPVTELATTDETESAAEFDSVEEHEPAASAESQEEPLIFVAPGDTPLNPYDSLPDADPELTIDQIQDMLHTEIFNGGTAEEQSPETEVLVSDPGASEEQIWIHGRMLDEHDEAKRRLTGDIASVDAADDAVFALPLFSDEREDQEETHAADFPGLTTDSPAIERPGADTKRQSPAVMAPDVWVHGRNEAAEEVLTWVQPSSSVDSLPGELETYEPRLLQDAAARVAKLHPEDPEMAEGASDNSSRIAGPAIPDASPVEQHFQPSILTRSTNEAHSPSPETTPPKSAGRFHDLFTRLRKMQNRSA